MTTTATAITTTANNGQPIDQATLESRYNGMVDTAKGFLLGKSDSGRYDNLMNELSGGNDVFINSLRKQLAKLPKGLKWRLDMGVDGSMTDFEPGKDKKLVGITMIFGQGHVMSDSAMFRDHVALHESLHVVRQGMEFKPLEKRLVMETAGHDVTFNKLERALMNAAGIDIKYGGIDPQEVVERIKKGEFTSIPEAFDRLEARTFGLPWYPIELRKNGELWTLAEYFEQIQRWHNAGILTRTVTGEPLNMDQYRVPAWVKEKYAKQGGVDNGTNRGNAQTT